MAKKKKDEEKIEKESEGDVEDSKADVDESRGHYSDESELVEAEEVWDDDGEISEEDFELSDISIGDIGLATSNTKKVWDGNLERSLGDEREPRWEEGEDEREEDLVAEGIYSANPSDGSYISGDSSGGLSPENKVNESYGSGVKAYDVDSVHLQNLKDSKDEKKFWSNERLPGMSRLDDKSLKQISGTFVEGYKGRHKEQKYD